MALDKDKKTSLSVRRAVNAHDIVMMRAEGKTFKQIETETGISDATACHMFHAEMSRMQEQTEEKKDEIRQTEIIRLNRLIEALWEKASGGDEKAVNSIIKAGERIAKLLGLETPVKAEVELTGELAYRVEWGNPELIPPSERDYEPSDSEN